MSDPLVLKFDVETNRAKQGMADLAGSIADNMARVATSMTGGASKVTTMGGALEGLVANARRASLAVGTDILKVANDVGSAATKTNANLQDVAVAFTRAAATSNTASTAISTGWATGTTALSTTLQQVPALGTAVEIFVAYKVAILGVAAAFALFQKSAEVAFEQVKKLQDIQKGSEAAGVGSTFYQDQTRDLQRFGMTAEEAAKSLIKARGALSGSVGETGGLQEAGIFKTLAELRDTGFTELNAPLNRLLGAAPDDIETRTRAARDAMQALHKAAEETGHVNLEALANQIGRALGYSKDATEEVKKLGDASTQSGNNFDEALVNRSKELDQKIADVHRKLEDDLKPAMSDLAKLALDFKEFWNATLGPIERIISVIGEGYARLKLIHDLSPNGQGGVPGGLTLGDDQGTGLADQSRLAATRPLLGVTGISARAGQLGLPNFDAATGAPIPSPNVPTPPPRPAGLGQKAAAESADEVDTYIKSLQKAVEVLRAENETFGQSNTLKAEAVDLERALAAARTRGTPLTDKEREAVKKLADEEGAAKDRAEELRRAQEAMNEQAQFLGNQLLNAFDKIGQSGTKATDVIKDMVKALIRAAEQALLLGSGPLANLFGTQGKQGQTGGLAGLAIGGLTKAFGGGGGTDFEVGASDVGDVISEIDSEGGLVGHGRFRKYVPQSAFIGAPQFAAGGGIPIIGHPGELILNAAQQKNVASRMGSPRINVTHAPVINGTGLSKEEVFSVIQRSQKEFSRQIGPIFSDWQRRYG